MGEVKANKICRSLERFGSSSTATWIPISNWESIQNGTPRRMGIFVGFTRFQSSRFTLGYFPRKDTLNKMTSLISFASDDGALEMYTMYRCWR